MAISISAFHHGLRLYVTDDQAPPIEIAASSIILLIGTAPKGPYQTPTLTLNEAQDVSLFGKFRTWHMSAGITIPEALAGIRAQGGAQVVVINVLDTATDLVPFENEANRIVDRRGVLSLGQEPIGAIAIPTSATINRTLPPSGALTVTIPKGYTTVTGVKTSTSASLTLTYNSGTGLVTVTAGATFNDVITLTVVATWSDATDYVLNRDEATITARVGGRIVPGMEMGIIEFNSAGISSLTYAQIHAKVIGAVSDTTRTGMKLAETVNTVLHLSPKLIICPRLTNRDPAAFNVASPPIVEMDRIAKVLGGRVFAAAENALTVDQFVTTLGMYADPDSRVGALCWPNVGFTSPDGTLGYQPGDARLCGLQSVVDNSDGFHESASNRKVQGVLSVLKAVTHSWTEGNTDSDRINENGGVVFVSEQGYYKAHGVWQPNGKMLSVLRTADMINVSIVEASHWALDRSLNRERPRQIMQRVRALFRLLEADGVLIPNPNPAAKPDIWVDPELNTPDRLSQGKLAFSYRFNPPPLMTDITFTAHITRDYLENFVSTLTVG